MDFLSTQSPRLRVSFATAVQDNVPGDGGLFMPAFLEPFDDLEALLELEWHPRSVEILTRLLEPELDRAEVETLVSSAFDFSVPLEPVDGEVAALELFHGPTLSFKDFGVRFLARVLALLRARAGETRERTVLTATSGDTGAAVARAFWRQPGFSAVVLYPKGRVSALQERQFATLGDNVRAFAIEGSFDDCQALVNQCFADEALASELGLLSANSINVARLVAQILYYFEAAARKSRAGSLVVSVPCGNFGNLCAGLLAQRLGAPIGALVVATNDNRAVPDYLTDGRYVPRPSVATLSNAMDVGAPNNWQRVTYLFGGDWQALRAGLRWGVADQAQTRAAIADLTRLGYSADPHGAVAYSVLRETLRHGEQGVFLATAHPAKFDATFDPAQPLPPALAEVASRPVLAETLPVDLAQLTKKIRERTASAS
ncbi:MAG: threonine synthase [Acidobacteriota bacterium]